MKIVIDVMGGDVGPEVTMQGIAQASSSFTNNDEFILVGNSDEIKKNLKSKISIPYTIVESENDVEMHDSPSKALFEKPNSSIAKGLQLVADKKGDAFFSAGNTGAVLAFSIKLLGRIKGVLRPALGTIFPIGRHPLVLDVGATVDIKPEMLYQFALMGSEYVKSTRDIESPLVGLLSVGEEDSKGSVILKKAFELISQNKSINFLGNIEGDDFFTDKVDVIVCDGFMGNVILKFGEGIVKFLKNGLKETVSSSLMAKMGMGLAYPSLKKFFKKLSYDEYGGAPLLGVNGISIVGHGKSNARAVESAILNAKKLVEHNFVQHIKESFEKRSNGEKD